MSIRVRVPATTANLGPGFDCLGVALQLHNTVTLLDEAAPWPDDFIADAARAFYQASGKNPRSWALKIEGDIPRSRGLGSSVSVRLGLLMALNIRADKPLSGQAILDLTIGLEGHPDNAVPAFYGGFAACGPRGPIRAEVDSSLKFIVSIPEIEVATKAARAVLPPTVSLKDAILNLQGAAVIVGAFVGKDYPALRGSFEDRLHQPFRSPLIPGCRSVMDAAVGAGALGAFISGSGSAMMALALRDESRITRAMEEAFHAAGVKVAATHVLCADNAGARELDS